jgi:bifunctional DNA-binding transcriptional regulator/antitoxin component of YhaV-PrlF toxin-antitoxin module
MVFINPDILKDGFNIRIREEGPRGGTIDAYWYKINSFKEYADDDYNSFNNKRDRININSGQLIFASNEQFKQSTKIDKQSIKIEHFLEHECIKKQNIEVEADKWYDETNKGIIYKIINSPPEDMLDKIRWINIWNKVFKVKYLFAKECTMKMVQFLSCFEYIGRPDIAELFQNGYSVDWPDNTYYSGCISEEVKEYLCKECDVKEDDLDSVDKYCAVEVEKDFEKSSLDMNDKKNNYTKLINKGNYSTLIFVRKESKAKKTEYVTRIVETFGIILNEAQQKELCDILGEISEEKRKNIIELQDSSASVSECIFNDGNEDYKAILEQAKKDLPSVWTKNSKNEWGIKKWLCEPYRTHTDGYVFQGYGYQCPLCGSSSKIHSLSGLKLVRRVKNGDEKSNSEIPYLHFIVCLNCADMIEGAKKITIKDYDGANLLDVIDHFEEVCYCSDRLHMYNNSKMKTMKLIMEIDGQEFCEDIKVSFLHLALFAKLRKDKKCPNENQKL